MVMLRITLLATAIDVAWLLGGGGALAFDPGNWDCQRQMQGGAEIYTCRDCGPPQPEAYDLQICEVHDFTVGVDAFPKDESELVIIVTPYLVHPTSGAVPFRPPDRLELRRAPGTTK